MTTPDPLLWTVPQAARAAHVSRSTGYALVRRGVWPSLKVASRLRVPKDEFLRWIADETQQATLASRARSDLLAALRGVPKVLGSHRATRSDRR